MEHLTREPQAQIITDFLEGYGADTLKEYGQSFFEILSIFQQQSTPQAFMEDVTGKFLSLHRLISSLETREPQAQTIGFLEGYRTYTLMQEIKLFSNN